MRQKACLPNTCGWLAFYLCHRSLCQVSLFSMADGSFLLTGLPCCPYLFSPWCGGIVYSAHAVPSSRVSVLRTARP